MRGGRGTNGTTLRAACDALAARAGGTVAAVYAAVLHGCVLEFPARGGARASATVLAGDPAVARVEEDGRVHASAALISASSDAAVADSTAASQSSYAWGLDRVDECDGPLDGRTPRKVDATGVHIYILDTGIDRGHSNFVGRIDHNDDCHVNEVRDKRDAFDDDHGHR